MARGNYSHTTIFRMVLEACKVDFQNLDDSQYMLDFIKKVIQECGTREAGSAAEAKAANLIQDEMGKFCDRATSETFSLHPKAFLGFIRIAVPLFVIAMVFYLIYPLVSLITAAIGSLVMFMQFFRYAEFTDRFYAEKESQNVVGVIYPRDTPTKTLILSAHHDSAYEFTLFHKFGKYAPIFMVGGIGGILLMVIFAGVRTILFFSGDSNSFVDWFFIAFLAISPMLPYLYNFTSEKSVPGAMDNLSGVAVLLGIAKFLASNKETDLFPQHTQIILVSFGGEEAGLRGSRRFVARHLEELKAKDPIFLNFDGVCKAAELEIVEVELQLGIKYPESFVHKVKELSEAEGLPIKLSKLPFGATDAVSLAKAGLTGSTLAAVDMSNPATLEFYHTRDDILEVIEPASLRAAQVVGLKVLFHHDHTGFKN